MRLWWGDTPAQDENAESSLPSTNKETVSDQQDVKEQEPVSCISAYLPQDSELT